VLRMPNAVYPFSKRPISAGDGTKVATASAKHNH
jgi:hypothetical protein